jgi:uncharacterized membrane protein HdeD (DUF308 family)
MGSASTASSNKRFIPWWLVIFEGLAAIVIGFFLLTTQFKTILYAVQLVGIFWLVTGVLTIAAIFLDRNAWIWKLVAGILAVIAAAIVLQIPLGAQIPIRTLLVYFVALLGFLSGVVFLWQAMQGAGGGVGVLGVLSMLLGIVLLGKPAAALASVIPVALGVVGILFGFLAIVMAFVVRSSQ